MKEVIEKYYLSSDGKKFNDELECKEYEDALSQLKELKKSYDDLRKKIANAEYVLYAKGKYLKSVTYSGGNGHDGYYYECPSCGALVGGYEGRNTSLTVDKNTYKCEKCGNFFNYS